MPSFRAISEEELMQIIAYIRFLGEEGPERGDHEMSPTMPDPVSTYLNVSYGVKSWLFTTITSALLCVSHDDHPAFFVGGAAAVLMRLELMTPKGDLVQSETYNKLFTIHVRVILLFLIPSIPAVLGNFLIPIMIGARDLAFPRLNLASWYLFTLGSIFAIVVSVMGGVDTGWTFYTPYSAPTRTAMSCRRNRRHLCGWLLDHPHRSQFLSSPSTPCAPRG